MKQFQQLFSGPDASLLFPQGDLCYREVESSLCEMGRGWVEGKILPLLGCFQNQLLCHSLYKKLLNFLKFGQKRHDRIKRKAGFVLLKSLANYFSPFVGDFEPQKSCNFKLFFPHFQQSAVFQGQSKEEKRALHILEGSFILPRTKYLRTEISEDFHEVALTLTTHILCMMHLKNTSVLSSEVEKSSFSATSKAAFSVAEVQREQAFELATLFLIGGILGSC